MTAFVILHYRAIDTTRSCVRSIRALAGDKHIVIVDNASPDGTGKQLAEEFAASPDVTVLLHGKNDGFARGNNVGVRWVCAHLDADFTVVLNNDVEIPQHDFVPQIARIYAQHPFDLLGPDIVSVFSGIHQSPKTLHGCTLESVRHKRACVARSRHPVLLLLLAAARKNSPAIWRSCRSATAKAAHRHHAPRRNVPRVVLAALQRSCEPFAIFSALSCSAIPSRFTVENVHVLFEMEILDTAAPRCALPSGRRFYPKSVVRYDPSISVLHYQYVASKMEYRSIVRRSKFVIDCLLDSLDAAEELILASEPAKTEPRQPVSAVALADA